MPQVVGTIDTQQLALGIMPYTYRRSLKVLLDRLGVPREPCVYKCAGNDANYKMKAMLAYLCTRGHVFDRSPPSSDPGAASNLICLQRLEEAAFEPLPPRQQTEAEDWVSDIGLSSSEEDLEDSWNESEDTDQKECATGVIKLTDQGACR